ncbi:MAG: hypothetical protein ABJB12_01480 [Pseudomonadota bacterium]
MSFRVSAPASVLSGLLALTCVIGCQKPDEHPAFAEGCEVDCKPITSVSLGPGVTGGAGAGSTPTAAGTGTLTGNVALLADQTFLTATAFAKPAVVFADGAAGEPVTAPWNGSEPYVLNGVAEEVTNWVSVKPDDAQGDALVTFQPVATNNVSNADLDVISSGMLDQLFTSVSAQRSSTFGQVVLFFRSVGTGAPVAGLHVTLPAAQLAAYAAAAGWVLDDGTAITNSSGLVVFGNVQAALAKGGTQTVTVTRPATATGPATSGGNFAIKVVEGDATIATVNVQL